ncbi:TPA_asm: protein 2 [Tanacetum virus 1]|uniref:Protein 2 n=1 Tax=Tanacetum virus 1 TaxID=2977993 RepID=A0A9N7AAU0_9RHAB|nr:TPA_asm: protein 2 [Tanacetum virus 1]
MAPKVPKTKKNVSKPPTPLRDDSNINQLPDGLVLNTDPYQNIGLIDPELVGEEQGKSVDTIVTDDIMEGTKEQIMEKLLAEQELEKDDDYVEITEQNLNENEDDKEHDTDDPKSQVVISPAVTRTKAASKQAADKNKSVVTSTKKAQFSSLTGSSKGLLMLSVDAKKNVSTLRSKLTGSIGEGSKDDLEEIEVKKLLEGMSEEERNALEQRIDIKDQILNHCKFNGYSLTEDEMDAMCFYCIKTSCKVSLTFPFVDGLRYTAHLKSVKLEDSLTKAVERMQRLNKSLELQADRYQKYNDNLYAYVTSTAQKTLSTQEKPRINQPSEIAVNKTAEAIRSTSLATLRKIEEEARRSGEGSSGISKSLPLKAAMSKISIKDTIEPKKAITIKELTVTAKKDNDSTCENMEVEESEEEVAYQDWDVSNFFRIINIKKHEIACLMGLNVDEVDDDVICNICLMFSEKRWLTAELDKRERGKLRIDVCKKFAEQKDSDAPSGAVSKKSRKV